MIHARNIDVKQLQRGFGKPVLLIHGDRDDVVPIEYSREAAANYGYATLKEIRGAGLVKIYEGIAGLKLR